MIPNGLKDVQKVFVAQQKRLEPPMSVYCRDSPTGQTGHGPGMGWALVIINNRFDFDIWTPNDEWSPLILNMPHGFLL